MVRVVRGAAIAVFAVASQEDGCTKAFKDPSGNPSGCCPFLEEVDWAGYADNNKTCVPRYPPAGQEYAQCRGRPEQPNSVVEECNAGLDCHNYDPPSMIGLQFGFCVDPQKQVQFATGVGCYGGGSDGGCCNTCPDGYEPIVDVKVCAAAAEFFTHSLVSSCTIFDMGIQEETLPWTSRVQETNAARGSPFGCHQYGGKFQCYDTRHPLLPSTVSLNNHTNPDISDCGNGYDTRVFCQLSNSSGSDFTV